MSSVQRPDSRASGDRSTLDSGLSTPPASVLIRDIRGKKSSSALDSRPSSLVSPKAPPSDWVYALKDVSFEVKRGELRTLGRSEKEISKKCLGVTKVPDSGRRRHQLLGIIGHNGAGTQTAWQPLGRLPKAARKVNRDLGKVEKDCHQAAPKEKQIRQFANQTPREGANQHHAVEDAEWVNQAGCGVDYDAGQGGCADCARGGVQSNFDRTRTEGLGSL